MQIFWLQANLVGNPGLPGLSNVLHIFLHEEFSCATVLRAILKFSHFMAGCIYGKWFERYLLEYVGGMGSPGSNVFVIVNR